MKYALTLFSFWFALTAFAQPVPSPTVPAQVTFADLTVRFDPDARRLIQQDVNALMNNRQYWNAKLDRALLYFPIIETILLNEKIPTDFKYLALQESSLTPDAVSSSQAVGFWQFKRETAQDYGMVVNEEVDERKNISSSTAAAARYLRRSNGMYTNWLSALFSFYLGTGGISKIVSPEWANSQDITLNGSTDRYMLRFFAHKLAVEYAIRTYQPVNTFSLVEYTGGAGKTIDEIANELSLNANDIRTYNRWLLIDHVPIDKPYALVIPTPNGQINDLRQRIAHTTDKPIKAVVTDDIGFPVLKRVTLATSSTSDPILYEINGLPGIQAQVGDNAGSLARKARISLSSFLRFNDLGERDAIAVGEVYYLAKKRKKALVPFHTARTDETMRGISQRYALRLKKLLRYNRMDRVQKLQVGRVLWLRERRPSKTPIEIINAPTPPVYDNSPATPSNRPVVERPGLETPANSQANNIPRNASERKRYQPKLVGSATPSTVPDERSAEVSTAPSRPTPEPATPPTRPAVQAPTPTVTTAVTPDKTNPGETVEVPVATPRDAGSPQRTIIVRSEGETVRERTTPARQVAGTYPETPDVAANTGGNQSGRTATPVKKPQPQQQSSTELTPIPRNQQATLPPLPPMMSDRPEATTPGSTKGRTMRHTIEAGQTYYSLSRYYGVRVDDLLAANNLTLGDKLSVGQTLVVQNVPAGYPTGQPTSAPAAVPAGAPRSGSPIPPTTVAPPVSEPTYHVVAKGETLYRISKTYNVTVEQLMQWNDLRDLGVKEGQKLKVSQ
ncbi:LysM peptidoglycan-binding domain-containing protein [Fibrivirga algicola]|uniref:LysM peptidoglycan-binding domain-containing protein n=1 Tax=Fibrivirga algicola TaxID=2950420 RepID=A0ABX0QGC7_9BACT|nr:LysM peptidoglycan-binding domain-containing protein [Fibrivirga algicola]NID09783.1 LysM peptidoglycan-binding domain-containing protein [Fibrivirga algicola]